LTLHGEALVGQKVGVSACAGPRRLMSWSGRTDGEGKYRIEGIAAGRHKLSIERGSSRHPNSALRGVEEYFEIGDGEVLTFNHELVPGSATVTGTVWLNGAPAPGLSVSLDLSDRPEPAKRVTRTNTDRDGRFTAAGLLPGEYDAWVIRFKQPGHGTEGFVRSFRVEAVAGETIEVTFSISIGVLRGDFVGLREGELGLVALIPGEVAGDAFTYAAIEELMLRIADRKEVEEDGAYCFPDVEPGLYTVFGAAFPADAEDDSQRFAGLRLSKVLVEVEEGQSTEVDIALD